MEYQPQHTGVAFRINWPQLALTALISFLACLLALLLFRALWVQKATPTPPEEELPLRRTQRRTWADEDDDEPAPPVRAAVARAPAPVTPPAQEPVAATVVSQASPAASAGAEG